MKEVLQHDCHISYGDVFPAGQRQINIVFVPWSYLLWRERQFVKSLWREQEDFHRLLF